MSFEIGEQSRSRTPAHFVKRVFARPSRADVAIEPALNGDNLAFGAAGDMGGDVDDLPVGAARGRQPFAGRSRSQTVDQPLCFVSQMGQGRLRSMVHTCSHDPR